MERVGRYEILQQLGQGGMAEVLLGRTTGEGGFEKLVAVKRILPAMTSDENFVKMFIDEARISAMLNHSNIGQIFEFGRADDSYFIAMEFIQGVDLRAIHKAFRAQKAVPPAAMGAYVIMSVCAALEYAHTKRSSEGAPLNIIHRDLSPSNVLVSFAGEVKLIDFGIAKAAERLYVTVGANLKGKYAYMSPEQAFGQPVDKRSDIFGAGTLLFELLTGRNPFRAQSDIETLERVQRARVPAPSRVVPDVPEELDRICLKALSRDLDERYATAGEMQEDLENFASSTAFGSRRMGRWMQKTYAAQIEAHRKLLVEARERAQSGALEIVATDELPPDLLSSQEELAVQLGSQPGGPVPGGGGSPRPAGPMGPGYDPTTAAHVPSSSGPMWPPGTPTPMPVEPGGVMRPDPSSSGMTPMPYGGMPPGPMGGPLQPHPTMSVDYMPPPMRKGGGMWVHVAVFSLIVAVGGVALYFLFGDSLNGIRDTGRPAGSVKVAIDPPTAAQVFVNDELHGTLPAGGEYLIEGLLPGKHRIKVDGSKIKKVENVVTVVKGKTTELYLRVVSTAPPPPASPPPGGEPEAKPEEGSNDEPGEGAAAKGPPAAP